MTQEQQVIEAMREDGGFATLRRLNEILDFSSWKTKTPEATVRRIVQQCGKIFKIRPGLWALEECREKVLKRFKLELGNTKSEEKFSHGYYQGLLVEIGKMNNKLTYIPAQDKNRLFMGKPLSLVADTVVLPEFGYKNLTRKAKSVDVIWFNDRKMPCRFYEVEHTTDIKNSLLKFYELQDFFAEFVIVADKSRELEFKDKKSASVFKPLEGRVLFRSYDSVAECHAGLAKVVASLM